MVTGMTLIGEDLRGDGDTLNGDSGDDNDPVNDR